MTREPSSEEAAWRQSLAVLASQRGDSDAVLGRAVALCRQLGVSPWIALGVAEGRITLADAALLDRAAKCKSLQAAVLDHGQTVAQLRTQWPYAPYFLAADLRAALQSASLRMTDSVTLATGLLERERVRDEEGRQSPVNLQPFDTYLARARQVLEFMRREGVDLATALAIEGGELDIRLARRRIELEREDTRRRQARQRQEQLFSRRRRAGAGPSRRRPPSGPR